MSVKKHFTSRFKGGSIIEMDFSQLEIVGLAILSNDMQLKQDLADGLDLHCVNTATLYHKDYQYVKDQVDKNKSEWVKKRRVVKIFSFQLQYGAGPKTMAENAGVPIHEAKQFIEAYYNRYPRVKAWQDENIEQVLMNAYPTNSKTPKGFPVHESVLQAPTGRHYVFREQDAPEFMAERGEHTSFSPTQIKNYPVQGFSTGDIVPLALGRVGEYLIENRIERDKLVICNTVHDSLIFDVHPKCPVEHLRNVKSILEGLPDVINKLWPDVRFDLPLSVGVEEGPSWGETKPIDLL